jgi:hypothetical protein
MMAEPLLPSPLGAQLAKLREHLALVRLFSSAGFAQAGMTLGLRKRRKGFISGSKAGADLNRSTRDRAGHVPLTKACESS